ncbi:hypothetical protein CLV30_12559 [Haloactinopolyspora alba]|uniref:PD-(D/E)XK nuclease superfamily protein n=1 Tax=Haloactinopolyspora alba TaxID=648780 RepID=A0A2P8DHH4_9ACTN|nr:hypothetical protein [Haloactinopolyspora alba]PSK96677.1 hypothetical protein CLV30_12559 [Haloactinopolyspora alba]
MTTTPAEFMGAAPAPMNGSSPWASRYAAELRQIVTGHAVRAPRNVQKHLGPSELGSVCDRQVAGKMAGLPTTNHVADPWPSIVGTAVHAWLAEAFEAENTRRGLLRFVTETRVVPHPNHSGTADLYDAGEQAVVDHKVLGETSMTKVRASGGPPRKYVVQLLLYGLGYRRLGLPVQRVALAAYPRTAATLDGLYVWERHYSTADDELLTEVFTQTEYRKQWADALLANAAALNDVPNSPDDSECYFCPFYRPQSARDQGPGCPGTVNPKGPGQ